MRIRKGLMSSLRFTMFLILLLALTAQTYATSHRSFEPVIEFGHEGGNLRPYRIGISKDGRVKALNGNPLLKVEKLSRVQVRSLLHKATEGRFWKRPGDAERPRLPDLGFVFVRVHASGRRVVEHRGAQSGPLGEFYSILSELVLARL